MTEFMFKHFKCFLSLGGDKGLLSGQFQHTDNNGKLIQDITNAD